MGEGEWKGGGTVQVRKSLVLFRQNTDQQWLSCRTIHFKDEVTQIKERKRQKARKRVEKSIFFLLLLFIQLPDDQPELLHFKIFFQQQI